MTDNAHNSPKGQVLTSWAGIIGIAGLAVYLATGAVAGAVTDYTNVIRPQPINAGGYIVKREMHPPAGSPWSRFPFVSKTGYEIITVINGKTGRLEVEIKDGNNDGRISSCDDIVKVYASAGGVSGMLTFGCDTITDSSGKKIDKPTSVLETIMLEIGLKNREAWDNFLRKLKSGKPDEKYSPNELPMPFTRL